MAKKHLSEMTLVELWQLFPIFLVEHNDEWKTWFEEEADRVKKALNFDDVSITHIGSTAINGIWAKSIIDILIEVSNDEEFVKITKLLTNNGYLLIWEKDKRKHFNRGYTEDGFDEKVYHVHLRYKGDNDEIYFRDYLNEHPDIAKQYETLKLSLWKKYEHDRDAYTDAKTEFVTKYTKIAKAQMATPRQTFV